MDGALTKNVQMKRLDLLMMELGLTETVEKAQALIMANQVEISGVPAKSAGQMVKINESSIILRKIPKFVSRGGIKLEHAITHWQLQIDSKVVLDVGASTGGFTDCLIQNGARKVYAVDVGYGQIDYGLRQDSRVLVMDKINARYNFALENGELVDLVTVDVSFISLTKILLPVLKHLKDSGAVVCLVKPQFEATRDQVGKGGVIKDPKIHAEVLARLTSWIISNGFRVKGLIPSVIKGAKGNQEFFFMLTPK